MERIKNIIRDANNLREILKDNFEIITLHKFAAKVDDLGYASVRDLKKFGINLKKLEKEVITMYREHLQRYPDDSVSINNIGVFFANRRNYNDARSHFELALKMENEDANIHENLRLMDILTNKPKNEWHNFYCTKRGGLTLLAYFDPHAM